MELSRVEVEELRELVDQALSEYGSNEALRTKLLDKLEQVLSASPQEQTYVLAPKSASTSS